MKFSIITIFITLKVTTPCTSCQSGWFGKYCQKQNIAQGKTAFQRSTFSSLNYGGPYNASLAVDGNTNQNVYNNSCSHTDDFSGAWWSVSLGPEMYNISQMMIYLRNDTTETERNSGLKINVSGTLCFELKDTTLTKLNITCLSQVRGNSVSISIDGGILTLCEVEVFVCSDGWFCSDCDKQCQCSNTSEACDKDIGYCRSGCTAGKQGEGCQQVFEKNENLTVYVDEHLCYHLEKPDGVTEINITCRPVLSGNLVKVTIPKNFLTLCEVQVYVCSDGWFGSDCDGQCQCSNKSEVCDKYTGYCKSGCTAGKHGGGCQQDCTDGFYGDNCSNECGRCRDHYICNKTNGVCANDCDTGFEGPYCQKCIDGYYGVHCKPCGRCKSGQQCNKTDGVCESGCESNFETPLCQKCLDFTYGYSCTDVCNCLNQCEVCDKVTGACRTGYQKSDTKSTVTVIVTSSLFAASFAAAGIIGVFYIRLRKEFARYKAEKEQQYTSLEDRTEQSVYDVIPGAHPYVNVSN